MKNSSLTKVIVQGTLEFQILNLNIGQIDSFLQFTNINNTEYIKIIKQFGRLYVLAEKLN
jgi:hypothetical protein